MSQPIPTIIHADGRVELASLADISDSSAYNHDLAPVPVAKRQWSALHFSALWAGMACNIPTYMIASGLIASGMNWWQALLTVFTGNAIVLIPILLNSHAGTKYGIPFPVLARASYGVRGSNLPALMRALVACGWFGINAWIGGQAVFVLIKALFPSLARNSGVLIAGFPLAAWLSFLSFWLLNMLVIFRGMDFLKKFESLAAPFVFTMTASLVVWSGAQAGGFGLLLDEPGRYTTPGSFLPIFIPSVTAMIGSWATLSLNMPDFTRFSKSQKDQIAGQIVALPASMTMFSAMGIAITSASMVLYPHMKADQLWDPVTLVGQYSSPVIVVAAMFTVMLSTLSVNIAANVVSSANDLSNCFPRWVSFRTGALITGIIGILTRPWHFLSDPTSFIFSWLLGYSGGLGSIAGVMIVDYWLIRKKVLFLGDLYRLDGVYRYSRGWNLCAVAATVIGCAAAWIGIVVPALRALYDYSWFVGMGFSALSYGVMMKLCALKRDGLGPSPSSQ